MCYVCRAALCLKYKHRIRCYNYLLPLSFISSPSFFSSLYLYLTFQKKQINLSLLFGSNFTTCNKCGPVSPVSSPHPCDNRPSEPNLLNNLVFSVIFVSENSFFVHTFSRQAALYMHSTYLHCIISEH